MTAELPLKRCISHVTCIRWVRIVYDGAVAPTRISQAATGNFYLHRFDRDRGFSYDAHYWAEASHGSIEDYNLDSRWQPPINTSTRFVSLALIILVISRSVNDGRCGKHRHKRSGVSGLRHFHSREGASRIGTRPCVGGRM